MKKKFALILTTCLLLAVLMTAFVACDNKTVTLSVYTVYLSKFEGNYVVEPKLIHEQKVGAFTLNNYKYIINEGETAYGGPCYLGLYYDLQCTKKVHPDTVFKKNTTLYALGIVPINEVYLICFQYEDQTYTFYQQQKEPLTMDDFVVSAYGKELDRTKLAFFRDEEMTQRIELEGKTFDTLGAKLVENSSWYARRVYVKLIE